MLRNKTPKKSVSANKDAKGWRILTRIANYELENLGEDTSLCFASCKRDRESPFHNSTSRSEVVCVDKHEIGTNKPKTYKDG